MASQDNKDMVKKRQCLVEHPFGTMKRAFDQGYMLMRGKEKVGAEVSLTVLAYNMKRVMNILGPERLINEVRGADGAFSSDGVAH